MGEDLIKCPCCDALVFTKEKAGRCNLCATEFIVIGDKSLKVEHIHAIQEQYLKWADTSVKLTSIWGG